MRQSTAGSLGFSFDRPLHIRPDPQSIADAYVYLLGRMLVIRQEHIDLDQVGADYNVLTYDPLGNADLVNPNFDVASLEGWLAVDDGTPAVLEVPEIINRYYTVQVMDEWGDVIANINPRTFPSHPHGTFVFVKPDTRVQVPPDAARIVLRSNKAKVLARIEVRQDRDGVVRLQRKLALSSHNNPSIIPAPPLPTFGSRELIGVEIFEGAEHVLATALDTLPGAAALQQKVRVVARYAASGRGARQELESHLRERVIPDLLDYVAKQSVASRNYWRSSLRSDRHTATDYRLRTATNLAAIWTNVADELVTFQTTRDAAGKVLNGSHFYVMQFAPNELPASVTASHWSMALLCVPGHRVVPNALGRFLFTSHSPLVRESDGSLRIFIGPRVPEGGPASNWLPSSDWKPFQLTMRLYVPHDVVKRGDWFPPAPAVVV